MQLDLIFRTAGDHVQYSGTETYRLYEHEGRYRLPDIFLQTEAGMQAQVELQDARVDVQTETADRGQLRYILQTLWQPREAAGWVTAEQALCVETSLPAAQVDAAFRASGGEPVQARVTWSYVFTGRDRVPARRHRSATLVFMPPGVPVPPRPARSPRPDSEALKYGVPAALREVDGRQDSPGFAAVDFGYSASTVTLFDPRKVPSRALDPAQGARLRADLAELIADGPRRVPELLQDWKPQRDLLLEEIETLDDSLKGIGLDPLLVRLRGGAALVNGVDPLLDVVCAALETRIDQATPRLRAWLAPEVLRIHERAFTVPPLEEMFLRQVVFDKAKNAREIPSLVTPLPGEQLTIALGEKGEGAIRGLKSQLLQPQPLPGRTGRDGREANSLDLIAHAFLHLVERAETFAHDDADGRPWLIRKLVVTYPTVTPPGARERLRDIAKYTLRMEEVVTDFDESVAAGLFFLLRDFGTNRREFGVEALRARSVKISDSPPTWCQNMLVLDVGAGTTDIALIRLTLVDQTERTAEDSDLTLGRYYVIKPEVLNSTGDPQLGGDYMTLRVFYWLKAAIVDAMIAGEGMSAEREQLGRRAFVSAGEPAGRLAEAVLNSGADSPAPRKTREVLRSLLPTDWRDNPACQEKGFQLLWDLAEDIKIRLSGQDAPPYPVSHSELTEILNESARELVPLLPPEGLQLQAADLDRLVRPVLTEAVKLASWLAGNTLGPDETLDRVMLSGKTSKMPLMRQVVVEELGSAEERSGGAAADGSLNWNRAAVTVEADFAKQAASIGACWANSLRGRARAQESVRGEMRRGRTQVLIDVDNLMITLPCSLQLAGLGSDVEPLLRAGTPLVELDAEGTIGARGDRWVDLMRDFQINRPLRTDHAIGWGVFHYVPHAAREGFEAGKEMYSPSADGRRAARVKAELEVDQTLTPYLHLCQGRPHYLVRSRHDTSIELRSELDERYWHAIEGRLRELPAAVWVTTDPDRNRSDGIERELFPTWLPAPDEDVTLWFTEFFRESEDATRARPGLISAPLPPPPDSGDYGFFLRWPNGDRRPLGTLATTGQRGPTARYVVTLDERGTLTLHRGNPPYWRVDSLYQLEKTPGAVYRVAMQSIESQFDQDRDPFNGRH